MKSERIAAGLTWAYAAAFGVPAIPVAAYLLKNGRLPTFLGLFPMYGGPWSSRVETGTFALLLFASLLVTLVAAWAGWLVRNGSKAGVLPSLVLLPLEAVFGLASHCRSPGCVAGATLLVLAWRSLD